MIPDTIRCARERAHQYGADWVVARKEAEALTDYPMVAAALAACAAIARRAYFRELAAIDTMMGQNSSPFAELG